MIIWLFASVSVFGHYTIRQGTNEHHLKVHLKGVFDSKVSLTPFNGLKAINPIFIKESVKNGETVSIDIPAQYLPGEFVPRFDYRAKETDNPYPSEKYIFIYKQDIELFTNPLFINHPDSTKFTAGEKENTVYSTFSVENNLKHVQIDLLKQFLMNYDKPKSGFYSQGVKEYEQRRKEYNKWLSEQTKTYSELYVSRLFRFQYIPQIVWGGTENERLNQILKNYFEGIDFSDTLIIHSRELNKLMNDYMGLYSMQATSKELADSMFIQAGRVACEKASKGDPKIYGWMVDYFYDGYETYGLEKGIAMLEQHINNPNCLTSKKRQIIKRLDGMGKLVPGSLSPNFIMQDIEGNNFDFHAYRGKAKYKLLLFWSADCDHCMLLVNSLTQWYNESGNKEKLDIVAVSLDGTETEVQAWNKTYVNLTGWKHLRAQGGVNSTVASDYAILSTPSMFLIESESNIIDDVPDNLDQLKIDLGNK